MTTSSTTTSATSSPLISSTSSLLPSPNFGHLINVKLTGENYLLWKAKFMPYLRSQRLLGYVDGTIKCPATTITQTTTSGSTQSPNPEYLVWLQQDQMVLSALLSSLSESVLSQVLFLSTSAEVWLALERMFSSQSRARTVQIRIQLSTVQKKDSSIADYFNRVKGLADTLAAIGQPLRDEETISYMLAGLDEDYDSLVTSISTRADPISLKDLYAHMLAHELRIQHRNPTIDGHSANFASRNNRGGRQGSRNRGCSGLNGSGGNNNSVPRRTGSNSSTNRPICQVCGKIGHSALKCYHRFDHSYQAEENHVAAIASTTPSYAVDPNSYIDTGATDHVTSDLD